MIPGSRPGRIGRRARCRRARQYAVGRYRRCWPTPQHRRIAGRGLDALCALGLQSQIVAPPRLGGFVTDLIWAPWIHNALPAGQSAAHIPDMAAIKAANRSDWFAKAAATPDIYGGLSAIAPTVVTGRRARPGRTTPVRSAQPPVSGAAGAGRRVQRRGHWHRRAERRSAFPGVGRSRTESTLRIWAPTTSAACSLAIGRTAPAPQRFTDKSLPRDRHLEARSRHRLRRPRHRLPVVRLPGRHDHATKLLDGPVDSQRPRDKLRLVINEVADRPGAQPPAACWTTCTGSTRPSTSQPAIAMPAGRTRPVLSEPSGSTIVRLTRCAAAGERLRGLANRCSPARSAGRGLHPAKRTMAEVSPRCGSQTLKNSGNEYRLGDLRTRWLVATNAPGWSTAQQVPDIDDERSADRRHVDPLPAPLSTRSSGPSALSSVKHS